MRSYIYQADPRDRAKSAAATAAIHVALAAAFLTGLALNPQNKASDSLKTFDVKELAPPPPPLVVEAPKPDAQEQSAPAGKKADASPIVAPPVRLPTPQPIVAAKLPGSGSSSTEGAAASGTGSGSGGSGAGAGGGGGGTGIATEARLLSGNRARLPRALLRPFAASGGYAHLLLTVADSGRVTFCKVMQSTGSPAVDDALCQVMIRQSRWTAARDTLDRPITAQVRYTATWSKW